MFTGQTNRKSGWHLLSDRRDLERIADRIRRLAALYQDPAMKAVTSDSFPASYSEKVRRVGDETPRIAFLRLSWRRSWMGQHSFVGTLLRTLSWKVTLWRAYATTKRRRRRSYNAVGVWHASCTCHGPGGRSMAADSEAEFGIDGLRVVDASIFPVVPCANTNIPTIMTAEKIADAILAESVALTASSLGTEHYSGRLLALCADAPLSREADGPASSKHQTLWWSRYSVVGRTRRGVVSPLWMC